MASQTLLPRLPSLLYRVGWASNQITTVTILCEVQGILSGGDSGDVTVAWPAALTCCHWDAE